MRFFVLALILFAGCKKEEEPDFTLRNEYIDALCRFYIPGDCADNSSATCGGAITFDTLDDCSTFLKFGLSGCTGYNDVLNENESTVRDCISQLEDFDCVNGSVCEGDTGGGVMTNGACGEVDDLISAQCPEDTDSG